MVNSTDRLKEIVRAEGFHWGVETAESYHALAAQGMAAQWKSLIAPILGRYPIDYSKVIDFAAGFGRNTRMLLEAGAGHVTMVDVNPDCVSYLRHNLVSDRATAVLNDGFSLAGLDSSAYTFVYSFDAMVHFDLNLVLAYLPEFARVLKPGGHAFIHHSNYTGAPGGDFRKNPHLRNFMSAPLFAHIAIQAGFSVLSQKLLDWGVPELDCLTVLKREG